MLIRGGRRKGRFQLVRGICNEGGDFEEGRDRILRIVCHCCCTSVLTDLNRSRTRVIEILPAHVDQTIERVLSIWSKLRHFRLEIVDRYDLPHGRHDAKSQSSRIVEDSTVEENSRGNV